MPNIIREKLEEQKPLIVEFGGTTCVSCKVVEDILRDIQEEYKDAINVLNLDIYQNFDMAQQFNIRSIPTLIFLDTYGQIVKQHIGPMQKNQIKDVLKEHFEFTS